MYHDHADYKRTELLNTSDKFAFSVNWISICTSKYLCNLKYTTSKSSKKYILHQLRTSIIRKIFIRYLITQKKKKRKKKTNLKID